MDATYSLTHPHRLIKSFSSSFFCDVCVQLGSCESNHIKNSYEAGEAVLCSKGGCSYAMCMKCIEKYKCSNNEKPSIQNVMKSSSHSHLLIKSTSHHFCDRGTHTVKYTFRCNDCNFDLCKQCLLLSWDANDHIKQARSKFLPKQEPPKIPYSPLRSQISNPFEPGTSLIKKSIPLTERTIPLVIRCPTGCNNNEVIEWVHSKCGSKTLLRGDGYLTDEGCKYTYHICEAKFNCGCHHEADYLKPKFNDLVSALGAAMITINSSNESGLDLLAFLSSVQKSIMEKKSIL